MGTLNIPADRRTVATLKNGREITVDVSTMSIIKFRGYLANLLERTDLTEESRKKIEMALGNSE